MTTTLAMEDERALSILRRINYSPDDRQRLVRAVTVLGSDLYALAERLAGAPDGSDEEWLSAQLLMDAERELIARTNGWAGVAAFVDALMEKAS